MPDTVILPLPVWAVVGEKRRAHIARVVALLAQWADRMHVPADEAQAWHDAGLWHDALRDADESALRTITKDEQRPLGLLHGPAASMLLSYEGESRVDVLDAIQWHTVGWVHWQRVGRALYMADFLEPGRQFMRAERAYLAANVPTAFNDTFRQVVQLRMEWAVREGKALASETVALWNSLQ
jgi:2-amino-4-hydroxy-6-hydroxymethyldihydropteridine diphosphokinase